MAKYLVIHHLGYSCHVCGGATIVDDFDKALDKLEPADEYDPEPSGIVVVLDDDTVVLAHEFRNGKNRVTIQKIDTH